MRPASSLAATTNASLVAATRHSTASAAPLSRRERHERYALAYCSHCSGTPSGAGASLGALGRWLLLHASALAARSVAQVTRMERAITRIPLRLTSRAQGCKSDHNFPFGRARRKLCGKSAGEPPQAHADTWEFPGRGPLASPTE